ncbi:MAG: hypothetical protein AAF401_07200 [Pseudomonadota bacterium]
MTFVFDMPEFTNGAFAGQSSELTIIADNGGSSVVEQSFLNSDITSFEVSFGAITRQITASTADGAVFAGTSTYLTTDAVGNGFLDLSENIITRTSFFLNGDQIQLGTTIDGGGFIPYFVRIGSEFGFTTDQPSLTNVLASSVNGVEPTTAVPAPAPLAMLFGALVWFGIRARRA